MESQSVASQRLLLPITLQVPARDADWITQRTGIESRRHARPEQATSDLCVEAARKAIRAARVNPSDIDLVVVGTFTPDFAFPSTACLVQDKLDLDAAAMDGSAPLVSVEVRHLEGALGRPDPNGGVLSHFEAPYAMYSVGMAPVPAAAAATDERIAAIRSAAEPWLSRSAYFNFAEAGVEGRSLYPGGAYDRLTEIRAEMDPDGVFQAKHAID